jgi:hypothetical protein
MSVWTLLLVCSILCDGVSAADFPPFDASVWIVVWVLAGVCVVLIVVVVLSVLLVLSKKKARLQAKAAPRIQEKKCKTSEMLNNVVQPLFFFIQMHFIFCNSQVRSQCH